ncbi:perlucin-like protein [Dreissena polymorpha]|uniref:perlucin-like protein n=1 Tax=Dreissena polymorpha TaxID=45954 RepID=UPI00226499B5|nr:perlucin-like protein [Dreissena polymorpha]
MSRDVCSDCGSQVVTLESEEEDKFVTAKFISLYENGSVGYWLGIKKTENGSLPNVSYNNFSPVEMNGGLNEMCFGVYEAANWTWVDLRCDMNYNIHVVCETVP